MQKRNLLFTAVIFFLSANLLLTSKLLAQPWMEAPYLPQQSVQKKQMGQALNYSDIETAFNNYWLGKPITPGCGYKPFKRWLENNRFRLMPDGSLPTPAFLQSVYQPGAAFKNGSSNPTTLTANWTPLGPFRTPNPTTSTKNGFGVGRMNCIAIHPADTNIMFAASPGGGLWKTINGGQNWVPLGDNFANMGVSDIAIDPTNPNVMYLATGDCDGFDTWSYGVLKTIDGGLTWTNYATFFQNSFQKLYRIVKIHPIPVKSSWHVPGECINPQMQVLTGVSVQEGIFAM